MAVHINTEGDLVITIPKRENFDALDELEVRREALYDAITEHNNNDYIGSDLHYGLVSLLKDLEPSPSQWKIMVEKPTEN